MKREIVQVAEAFKKTSVDRMVFRFRLIFNYMRRILSRVLISSSLENDVKAVIITTVAATV